MDVRAQFLDEWLAIQVLCESLVEAGGNVGAAFRVLEPVLPNRRL